MSIILCNDTYKNGHFAMYPKNLQYMSSYIEARGGIYDFSLFFGLQIFLKNVLSKRVKRKDVDKAEKLITAHGMPFNREGWDYIVNKRGGYLPLSIQAVPEGIKIPTKNVLVQVTNTDPNCAWLVQFIESALLRAVWYPTTVATRSKHIKNIIQQYLNETSDNTDVSFKLHDMGDRGVSSDESAGLGALAHLINFRGSDTPAALLYGDEYYGEFMPGYNITASEHSTVISWGRKNELEAYQTIIDVAGRLPLYAQVADSYDIHYAAEHYFGGVLKDKIIDNYNVYKSTMVLRSDSGDDPASTVLEIIEILGSKFGYEINSKGYKVLHPSIRILHSDKMTEVTIKDTLSLLKKYGWAAENVGFGMGGELLQNVTRDTLGFAMKPSAIKFNGLWEGISKDPKTASGKKSKAGRLALVNDNGYKTVPEDEFITQYSPERNLLQEVFRDGQIFINHNFNKIRKRSDSNI